MRNSKDESLSLSISDTDVPSEKERIQDPFIELYMDIVQHPKEYHRYTPTIFGKVFVESGTVCDRNASLHMLYTQRIIITISGFAKKEENQNTMLQEIAF